MNGSDVNRLVVGWARIIYKKYALHVAVILIGLFYLSGMCDHFFAQSFDKFAWPPYIQLEKEVEEMVRERDHYRSIDRPTISSNVWNRSIERIPRCGHSSYADTSQHKRILVVVKSAVGNFEARSAIRTTWGAIKEYGGYHLRVTFALASADDTDVMTKALREADQHSDIVLSRDFVDQYYNNGRKFGVSLWLSAVSPFAAQCPSAFTLLIDDDYMLSAPNLITVIRDRREDEPLYEGWRVDSSPFRFRLHKHSVSLEQYPFDAYPPYITAGAVVMSAHSVVRFYYASLLMQLYPFDDVYAGILAKQLSIRPRHNANFLYWSNARSRIDWSTTVAAHGFSSNDLLETFPPNS